jgi:hypothetical protein
MILHLGVHDHPYVGKSGVTTGDVAEWLEGKYHVMEVFAGTYIDEISDAMADNVAGAIEQIIAGAPIPEPEYLFIDAMAATKKHFEHFLTMEEMAGWPGVPTQAALDGAQSRFKKRHGPRRPSFVDSGEYFASFVSWID